jgi:hypothetical protein
MAQGFIAVVSGKLKVLFGIASSAGAGDAGKYIVTDAGGKLDPSFLPSGIGANQVVATASEALTAGDFVNLYLNAGALNVRKADNSNSREAWGYVEAAVSSSASATVKRLGTTNASRTGLTIGSEYWLGTAGGVISTPLDANDTGNAGKMVQYLGIAKSATELVTAEFQPVLL